ncbi:MAG: response regulator [Bacteroidota bacterium]
MGIVLSEMFKKIDCIPTWVTDGSQVLDAFPKMGYDLIFLDIHMPIMSGVEAMQALREKYLDLPPIIALSAGALQGDAEYYIEQGMDDYVTKPVTLQVLREKIAYWMVQKSSQTRK